MSYSPRAIMPGILLGILAIIFLTGLVSSPAAANPPAVVETVPKQPEKAPSACEISPSYPDTIQQWCLLIGVYAVENALDPNLVAAVMLQESGGDAQAYSHSGAVGLMQVMPRDGIAASFMCANGPCFASRPSMDELFDPAFNLSYSCTMLAGLVSKYGNVRDALRAYGPMDMGYGYADIVLGIYERYR